MKSGLVKVSDGAHIYYEMEGSGRPIVLIHGWGCSGRFYKKNMEGLKDCFTVVTIDLRGHGRSSRGLTDIALTGWHRISMKSLLIWICMI